MSMQDGMVIDLLDLVSSSSTPYPALTSFTSSKKLKRN